MIKTKRLPTAVCATVRSALRSIAPMTWDVLAAALIVTVLIFSASISGCGSGAKAAQTSVGNSLGAARIAVHWPSKSRGVLDNAVKVVFTLTDVNGEVHTQTATRPSDTDISYADFGQIAVGPVTISGTAYDATGAESGSGSTQGSVATGGQNNFSLSLQASTSSGTGGVFVWLVDEVVGGSTSSPSPSGSPTPTPTPTPQPTPTPTPSPTPTPPPAQTQIEMWLKPFLASGYKRGTSVNVYAQLSRISDAKVLDYNDGDIDGAPTIEWRLFTSGGPTNGQALGTSKSDGRPVNLYVDVPNDSTSWIQVWAIFRKSDRYQETAQKIDIPIRE